MWQERRAEDLSKVLQLPKLGKIIVLWTNKENILREKIGEAYTGGIVIRMIMISV